MCHSVLLAVAHDTCHRTRLRLACIVMRALTNVHTERSSAS
jgi:hypothetical protein